MPASPRASRRPPTRGTSIRSRSVSRKGWAPRWARRWRALASSSSVHTDSGRCSAEGCGKRACWRRRPCTRLSTMWSDLAEDHENARALAAGVAEISGVGVDVGSVETNMVYLDVDPALGTAQGLVDALHEAGVWTLAESAQRIRAVTHLEVTREDRGSRDRNHREGGRRPAIPVPANGQSLRASHMTESRRRVAGWALLTGCLGLGGLLRNAPARGGHHRLHADSFARQRLARTRRFAFLSEPPPGRRPALQGPPCRPAVRRDTTHLLPRRGSTATRSAVMGATW